MWEEATPEVEQEIYVGRAEAGNKIIFEHVNRAFGGIAPMGMG